MRHADRGASAAEYAGLVVLAALILGVLGATGVPAKVRDGCERALCQIFGGDCRAATPDGGVRPQMYPPPPPDRAPGKNGWQYADQMPPRAPIPTPTCANSGLKWSEGLHAHNDYENGKPLTDALDHGATSVEVDVFDRQGRIAVGHDPHGSARGTLRELYIDPLRERAAKNGGKIIPGRDKPFQLHIEIKQKQDEKTYKEVLDQVKHLPSNVRVVLSGGRPDTDKMMSPPLGPMPDNVTMDYVPKYRKDTPGADGNAPGCSLPSEIDPGTPAHPNPNYRQDVARKVTVINGEWGEGQCGDSDGDGKISKREQLDLDRFVSRAHELGYQTRFWGVPDGHGRSVVGGGFSHFCPFGGKCSEGQRNDAWHAMQHAGVDILGTNHLTAGENFIHSCGEKF